MVCEAKPSKNVEVGAEIRLRQGNDERTVTVLMVSALAPRGGPSTIALL